ncbi:MAG: hypothetical protein OXF88_18045 [Rhodobacteraceae bacterium]|nr:hypothetical protein [Paracoccaceae bacterium]MCY4136761.1 hypothetical protein [Paracoccaceae bacterium]
MNRFTTEITEDKQHYYIRITASERERAKRIPGRRWDPGIAKWVCPRTKVAYDAIMREFTRHDDRVVIGSPPAAPDTTPQQILEIGRNIPPDWAKSLTEMPKELEDIKAGAAASTESLDRLLEQQQTILEMLSESEPAPGPRDTETSTVFSRRLRDIAAGTAQHDASFIDLTQSFEIEDAPIDCVARSHSSVEKSLREFTGTSNPRTTFVELIDTAKKLELFPRGPVNVVQELFAMNRLRNSLVHSKPDMDKHTRTALAILYFLNLARVWPYFASEQRQEHGETLDDRFQKSSMVYADGRFRSGATVTGPTGRTR